MTAPAYRCTACQQVYFPSSLFCPACGAGSEQTSGVGRSPENGHRRHVASVSEGRPVGPWLTKIARQTPLEPALERRRIDQSTGALIGTACGDSMGLLVEGQAPSAGERHAARLALANECGTSAVPHFPTVYSGRYSDDTQQARALVEVFSVHGHVSQDAFAARLAAVVSSGRAYGWGASSMKAVRRMVNGESWREAAAPVGECGSAPVMRVVPLGALLANEPENTLVAEAAAQARVTHADLHCTAAAVLVALAARAAVHQWFE